jgi:hypothetical protein
MIYTIEINDPWRPNTVERIQASFDGRWWISESNGGRISPKYVKVISTGGEHLTSPGR